MLKISWTKTGPVAGMKRADEHRAQKETYEEMGLYWVDEHLPKHFTHAGAREYHYTERESFESGIRSFNRSYQGQKLRKFGHTLPLMKTGAGMRRLRVRDVRPTKDGATVVLNAPVFNLSNKYSRVDMRAELTAISDRDELELQETGDDAFQGRIDAIRDQTTKTL